MKHFMCSLGRRAGRVSESSESVESPEGSEVADTHRDVLGTGPDAPLPASHRLVRFLRGFTDTVATQGGDVEAPR